MKDGWDLNCHVNLMRVASDLKEIEPEYYKEIQKISHKLLDKYTRDPRISKAQKRVLDQLIGNWVIDIESGDVIAKGHLTIGGWSTNRSHLDIIRTIKFKSFESLNLYNVFDKMEPWIPREVKRFNCSRNNIRSLKNGPSIVRMYDCSKNRITSLKYMGVHEAHTLDCSENQIKSLIGMPKKVSILRCHKNKLRSLDGCGEVERELNVSSNLLVSLKGCPINLSLRDINFKNNPVTEGTLKMVYREMRKNGGDYESALNKVWKSIPLKDQYLMYSDNPGLNERERKGYELVNRVQNFMI